MKRWIKALLPSEIVCLQKCNRSSQIKVRFRPCTGAATMGHSVEFARKKNEASTNCRCSSRGFLPASLSYTGTYFERSLRDGCVGIPYCQLCADPPAPALSPTILCQHERVSASFSHVGRAASVRRLATSSEFFRVCSQWPQLLRRGFRACYAVFYAIWYVLIYAVTPCASERSAFSASFRRVATGHAWPSEIRERHS